MGRTKRKKKKPQKKVKRKQRVERKLTPDELWDEARSSPGALEMEKILAREGKLFVPVGPENNEGASASSQSRQRSIVHQHLKKLDDEYGKWAAGEYAMSAREANRSSRPQTPIGSFGDYMNEQEAQDKVDEAWKEFLNKKTGTTYKTSEDDFNFFGTNGGKRKSRRRKKSRRRRKKSRRRRKTKRKSRRRRK